MCFSAPGSGWPWNTDPDPKYFIKENVMSNSDILKQLNETMKNFRESRVPITCIYTKMVSKENKCISCCSVVATWVNFEEEPDGIGCPGRVPLI